MSKPVRQGTLFECLMQLHTDGVWVSVSDDDDVLDAMPRLKHKRQQEGSAASLPALGGAGGSDSSLVGPHIDPRVTQG